MLRVSNSMPRTGISMPAINTLMPDVMSTTLGDVMLRSKIIKLPKIVTLFPQCPSKKMVIAVDKSAVVELIRLIAEIMV